MTKLMKVCLENEPPIIGGSFGPEKCASAETLDKNKKTLIYLCLDVGCIYRTVQLLTKSTDKIL